MESNSFEWMRFDIATSSSSSSVSDSRLLKTFSLFCPYPRRTTVKYCFAGKSVLGIFFSLRDYCCVCSPDLSIFSMRSCGPVNSLRVGTCVPVVARDELLKICSRIGGNEAPGSIDISDNTHKTQDRRSNMFAELCKTGQLLVKPFSYRPIPSLDAVTRI